MEQRVEVVREPVTRWVGAALCWALVACGGSDSPERSAGRDPSAAAAADAPARSACDLITGAEMEAIVGEAVEVRPGPAGPTESKCEYWGSVNKLPYFSLTAYWRGGREQWEIHASGYGQAADLMRQAEGVELDSIVQPGPVPGLGDAAIYAELLPAVVLDGDRMLEMYLFYLPNAKRQFRPLAEKILSRL